MYIIMHYKQYTVSNNLNPLSLAIHFMQTFDPNLKHYRQHT